jgi:hypothetical protein
MPQQLKTTHSGKAQVEYQAADRFPACPSYKFLGGREHFGGQSRRAQKVREGGAQVRIVIDERDELRARGCHAIF